MEFGLRSGFRAADFFDESALQVELRRAAEICHGCRLCFNLCPSFPELFRRIDNADGEVGSLGAKDFAAIVDLCFQCKICFVKCPYTPPHEFDLDFPRLMLRAKAVRAKSQGLTLQERILGNTDRIGRMGSAMAPLSNWANSNSLHRRLLEQVAGLDRRRVLPKYHRVTFANWFKKRRRPEVPGGSGKAAIFHTCFVNHNEPEIGRAAVQVLEHNGVEVINPPQRCCGMPFLDVGDLAAARRNAQANVASLRQVVSKGYDVVVLGPTCSYMLKQEYPRLLTQEAEALAGRIYDAGEYLMKLHKAGRLDTKLAAGPRRIAYHMACHLRAQNAGYKSRDLLQLLPGASVQTIERCCGVDGGWGMRKQYHELSLQVGATLFEAVQASAADSVATDCPLAAMQIAQGTGAKVLHPLILLRDAYGLK